eukprot:scaffold7457_cov73-Skeletonema_marinoi.AAC.1
MIIGSRMRSGRRNNDRVLLETIDLTTEPSHELTKRDSLGAAPFIWVLMLVLDKSSGECNWSRVAVQDRYQGFSPVPWYVSVTTGLGGPLRKVFGDA